MLRDVNTSSEGHEWATGSPEGIQLLRLAILGEWQEGRSPVALVRLYRVIMDGARDVRAWR